jgi:hypothetical protein
MDLHTLCQSISEMVSGIEENTILKAAVRSRFESNLESCVETLRRSVRQGVDEMFKGGMFAVSESQIVDCLEKGLSFPGSKEALEAQLAQCSYYWDYKNRFPLAYSNYVESIAQLALTSENISTDYELRIKLLLTLYGHDYFYNRNPLIVRISKPYTVGDTNPNKGKTPTVPQADAVCFVYNSEEVRAGGAHAIVSYNGSSLEKLMLDHIRVKLVEKKNLQNMALYEGIYQSRDLLLPVCGLQQYWQAIFVKMLKTQQHLFLERVFGNNGRVLDGVPQKDQLTESQLARLLIKANRFIGDRIGPVKYWMYMKNDLAGQDFFRGPVFADFVKTVEQGVHGLDVYSAFKLMTII